LDVAAEGDFSSSNCSAGVEWPLSLNFYAGCKISLQAAFKNGVGVRYDLLSIDYEACERAAGDDAFNLDLFTARCAEESVFRMDQGSRDYAGCWCGSCFHLDQRAICR